MRAHLDCIEVEVCLVAAGGHTGGRSTAHTNPVGRAANLDDQHANIWRTLLQVVMIYLSEATTAHRKNRSAQKDQVSSGNRSTCDNYTSSIKNFVSYTITAAQSVHVAKVVYLRWIARIVNSGLLWQYAALMILSTDPLISELNMVGYDCIVLAKPDVAG